MSAARANGELCESVQHDNGTAEAFLCWLWRELYGDETSGASVLTPFRALPEPFADRLDSQGSHNIYKAACVSEWGKGLEMLLAGLAESNAPVSPAEREEPATLLSAIGQPDASIGRLAAAPRTLPDFRRIGAPRRPAPTPELPAPADRRANWAFDIPLDPEVNEMITGQLDNHEAVRGHRGLDIPRARSCDSPDAGASD